jgi:CHAT domain-containing protein
VLGEAHPSFISELGHLALIAGRRGEDVRAAELRRQALALSAKVHGRDSSQSAQAHDNLVIVLRRRAARLEKEGRFDEARPPREEIARLMADRFGAADWRAVDARLEVARLALVAGLDPERRRRLAEADRLAKPVDDPWNKEVAETPKPSLDRAEMPVRIARALYSQLWEVEPARCRVEVIAGTLGRETRPYLDAVAALAWVYLQSQAPDRAAAPLREGQEIAARLLPERHPVRAGLLRLQALLHSKKGESDRAETSFRRALAVARDVHGRGQEAARTIRDELMALLKNRAPEHLEAGRFAEAIRADEGLLALTSDEYGAFDWRVTDARLEVAHVTRLSKLTADQRRQLEQADAREKGLDPRSEGEYRAAILQGRLATELREGLLGESDPEVVRTYGLLVRLNRGRGDLPEARHIAARRLRLALQTYGHLHPSTAMALNDFASLLTGPGERDGNLAALAQALEIRRKTVGTEDLGYATILHNLALERLRAGRLALARRNLYEVTNLVARLAGRDSLEYATCLGTLAMIGEDPRAVEAQLREALEIIRSHDGDSPRVADLVGPLIVLLRNQRRFDEAVPLLEDVLRIREKYLGPEHPDVADARRELAEIHLAAGRPGQAEDQLRRAFAVFGPALELAASRTEHEQRELAESLQKSLDVWMHLVRTARMEPGRAYVPVLAWKGSVFLRERRLHRSRVQAELLPRLDELEVLDSRIAALHFSPPEEIDRPKWLAEIKALRDRKRDLESKLAADSAAFNRYRLEKELTPEGLKGLLPADVALVDVVRAVDPAAPGGQDTRLVAFVVRRDRPIAMVDLAPEPELSGLIASWRRTLGTGPGAAERPADDADVVRGGLRREASGAGARADAAADPAAQLKRLTWSKWSPSLEGAATVLVSPDPTLARFPMAALPGRAPGAYLLDEVRLAVIPAARLLPDLLEAPGQPVGAANFDSLLLVGDVAYGADPGTPLVAERAPTSRRAARDGEGQSFDPLEGTRQEVDLIGRLFRDPSRGPAVVAELRGGAATESAFRQAAPRYAIVHVATHGFQSWRRRRGVPAAAGLIPQLREKSHPLEAESGVQPGLLCGLALAGANTGATAPADARRVLDDGILTALEAADLDLSTTRLVVLSACETGLGQSLSGEGVLGLQAAFQLAGARASIATLWPVDDDASKALMLAFYQRLRQGGSGASMLDALREAQRDMIRHYDPLTRTMSRHRDGRQQAAGSTPPAEAPLSPEFWAGFVLSGDWR